MKKTFVIATTEFDGQHHWPDAPEVVAHLRNPHRHMFHVSVTVQVFHGDRELEIIQLKHLVEGYFKERFPTIHPDSNTLELGSQSCEMLANDLLEMLEAYTDNSDDAMSVDELLDNVGRTRSIIVKVLEDGENGGMVHNGS